MVQDLSLVEAWRMHPSDPTGRLWRRFQEATMADQPVPDHPRHPVALTPGSQLHELLGDEISVDSFHHQAVDELGSGLIASARAADGVIEGIELPGRFVVAMQCELHEEWRIEPRLQGVVEAFVAAAGDASSPERARAPGGHGRRRSPLPRRRRRGPCARSPSASAATGAGDRADEAGGRERPRGAGREAPRPRRARSPPPASRARRARRRPGRARARPGTRAAPARRARARPPTSAAAAARASGHGACDRDRGGALGRGRPRTSPPRRRSRPGGRRCARRSTRWRGRARPLRSSARTM